MKTKIITAALSVLLFNSSAFSAKPKGTVAPAQTSSREVAVGKFQSLQVADNIQLVLVPDDQKTSITISGNAAMVDQVKISFKKNEMNISSKKYVKQGDVIVYVPAKDLNYITLGTGASVSGQGFLNTNNLTVFLNVGSSVDLKSFGDINIREADGCDFVYKKFEKSRVIRVPQSM